MFNEHQIQELLNIVSFQHIMFIGHNVGYDVLTDADRYILKKYGIVPESLQIKGLTPFEQSYYLGKLSAALGHKNTKGLTYNEFKQFVRRGQYENLTNREKNALKFTKNNAYTYIKGLENAAIKDTSGIIYSEQNKRRTEYEKVIKNSIKGALIRRETVKAVISEIGNKTGDWERNLGRIAETEMQNAMEHGRAEEIKRLNGEDAKVYKQVYPGACKYCIGLYLTDGIGSEPRLFTIPQLEANGNNYNVKAVDYKPTITPTHPYCRCTITHLTEGLTWDKEQHIYKYPLSKPKRIYGIKITVGDRVYNM